MATERLFVDRASYSSIRDRYVKGVLSNIVHRCTNPDDKKFAFYGGKGVECRLTVEDLEFLYERDRPDLMVRPTIERRVGDGHYERDNCCFLEMRDNQKNKKRQWLPCQNCGVVARPRTVNGKILCATCTSLEKFDVARLPKYVRRIIDEARKHGVVANGIPQAGTTLNPYVSKILLNHVEVDLRYAGQSRKFVPRAKTKYWHFNHPHIKSPIVVLIAKHGKQHRFFIVPREVIDEQAPGGFFIPVNRRPSKEGRSRKTEWYRYENAWHLFAPATEAKEVAA